MRTMCVWLALAIAALTGATPLARHAPHNPSSDAVEVDVVVVDDNGKAVDGLQQDDFQVREDGHPATVTSCVTPAASAPDGPRDAARSVVLILDDSAVSPRLTSRVQDIAKQFVARTGVSDELSVIRLSNRRDEPVGDRKESLMRIAEYRAGSVPFFGRETVETALTRIAKISGGFDQLQHERRAIIAIGSPGVFDIDEPIDRSASLIWRYWIGALTAAARSHASVYVIDPSGLTGNMRMERNGIVARTGGDEFYNSNDFTAAVQRIWQDTTHYYLVSYTPSASNKALHDISVRVNRPGVHVRARKNR